MAIALPVAVLDQSVGQRLILPVAVLDQSVTVFMDLPAAVLNQSGGVFMEIPISVLDQSSLIKIGLPAALLDQSTYTAPDGPALPVAVLDQTAIAALDLPIAVLDQTAAVRIDLPVAEIVVPTDAIVATLLPVSVSIVIPLPVRIAADLATVQSSISSIVAIDAQIDAKLHMVSSAIIGGSNVVDARLLPATSNIVVVQSLQPAVTAKLNALASSIVVNVVGLSAISGQLPVLQSSIVVNTGTRAAIDAKLLAIDPDLRVHPGTLAQITAALYAAQSDVNVAPGLIAAIDALLTVVEPDLFAGIPPDIVAQIITLVMNTRTNALTEYNNYPFNSFARWQGKTLAASSDGLHELDFGDLDGETEIPWLFAFGAHDFGIANHKVMEKLYASMRSNGDITLRVMVDDEEANEYVLSYNDIETIKQRRVKLGKGARGKYWQLEMESVEGCFFEFDSFDVGARQLRAKV